MEDQPPLVVGLCGKALTGKTATAKRIAPTAQNLDVNSRQAVEWDHLIFASTIYKMATTKQTIQGEQAKDRQLYELHETLLELLGRSPLYGAPPYDELVEMALEIQERPITPRGEKPRDFLQWVGTDFLRRYDHDCFVKWMGRKIRELNHLFWLRQDEEALTQPRFGVVVSDVRFRNEVDYIRDQPGGVLVKFTARPDVLVERAERRDGITLNPAQLAHASEAELDTIPNDCFDAIIDTSDLSLDEQTTAVLALVTSTVGSHAQASA